MPLPGGASDKAGNSYERRWTVLKIIELLERSSGSIRVEVPGQVGVGAEFRLIKDDRSEWHQAKRQRSAGNWSVRTLRSEGVLTPWWTKLCSGDDCYFVSGVGAPELKELADRARSAESWAEFDNAFLSAAQHRQNFNVLRAAWPSSTDEDCFEALKRVHVVTIDEDMLKELIHYRLSAFTDSDPRVVAALLAEFVDDSIHQERTTGDVTTFLGEHGIGMARFDKRAVRAVLSQLSSAYVETGRSLQISGSQLPMPAFEAAIGGLESHAMTVVTGVAGGGKSVVLTTVVEHAESLGWPTLAIRADRIPEASTTEELGTALGLEGSPAAALASLALGDDALLVVDQLDAVGVVSGRQPERLAVIESLLAEASAHPNIRVVIGCREFDLDNDRALRNAVGLDAKRVQVGALEVPQVREVLRASGVSGKPSDRDLEFLRTPLNLALFTELIATAGHPIVVPGSITELFDRFWEIKRTACVLRRQGLDEWVETIDLLVDEMSARQALAIPQALLDPYTGQAAAMESEGVVTTLQRRTGFVHETVFDYSWARRFVARSGRLESLLSSNQQDLFRRSQVRQLLVYERSADPDRYLQDLSWILTSGDVRLHLKVLAISLMASASDPTIAEWAVVKPLVFGTTSTLADHFWIGARRNPKWFDTLAGAGVWQEMLSSPDASQRSTALWFLAPFSKARPTDVGDLLINTGTASRHPSELLGFAAQPNTTISAEVADRLATMIDAGEFDDRLPQAWSAMLQAARSEPALAPRLAAATLKRITREGSELSLESSEIAQHHESALAELGAVAPQQYVDELVPVILRLAEHEARPEWRNDGIVADRIWHIRYTNSHHGVDDNLLLGAERAVEQLAKSDSASLRHTLATLSASNLEVAAILCVRGFLGDPDEFCSDAAEWLLATPGSMSIGYSDSPSWLSRELIEAISPRLNTQLHQALESAVRGFATPWERSYAGLKGRGFTELTLLNAFDESALSDASRRRLAELRRKFGIDDVAPPRGVWGGVVPAPIPADRARRMTDRQWIGAMRRYSAEDTAWRDGRLIGDAGTQAQVLAELASGDGERFGALFLDLDETIASAYRDAILRGLAKCDLPSSLLQGVLERTAESADQTLHQSVARLIESQAGHQLPPVAFDLLELIAATNPDPSDDRWDESEHDQSFAVHSIEAARLNSTRGAVALAIAPLLNNDPSRLPKLRRLISQLVQDSTQQVRSAMSRSLAAVLFIDADAALEWFEELLVGASDGLLGSEDVEIFIHYAIRLGHLEAVMPTLDRLRDAESVRAQRHRARQLTVASIGNPALDSDVESCLSGPPAERAGVMDVAVENLTGQLRRDRLVHLVTQGLIDREEEVRQRAAFVFHKIDDLAPDGASILFDTAAAAPEYQPVGEAALRALETYRHELPESALQICENFVQVHARDIGDIATAAAGTAVHAVRVAIRFHAQQADPELRSRCLDVIDVLVANRAHGIDEGLDSIER